MLRIPLMSLIATLVVVLDVNAAERSYPEEVRALAAVCSSGASVAARGAIEGRLNLFLRKVVSAEGNLEIAEGREDFLESFEDESLRIEALKVFNQCVIDAMKIIYNIRPSSKGGSKATSLLVPDPLKSISPGTRFSLRRGESIMLDTGGVMTFQANSRGGLAVYIYNQGRRNTQNNGIRVGSRFSVPSSKCDIIYYSKRDDDNKDGVHSFLYQCH